MVARVAALEFRRGADDAFSVADAPAAAASTSGVTLAMPSSSSSSSRAPAAMPAPRVISLRLARGGLFRLLGLTWRNQEDLAFEPPTTKSDEE